MKQISNIHNKILQYKERVSSITYLIEWDELCDDDGIILKKFLRNIVIHENLQVIG